MIDEPIKAPAIAQSGDSYARFLVCLKLLNAAFPQNRRYGSMYYIRQDMLISIDDLTMLKADGHTDFENIFATLVFKPKLDDLEEAGRSFFTQCVWTSGAGCFAYSNVINPDAPEGSDPYIRANGKTEWEARANLYLAVQAKKNHITIPPQELAESENVSVGEDAPDPLPKTVV